MSARPARPPALSLAVRAAALLLTLAACAVTLWRGPVQPLTALAFGLVVLAGRAARRGPPQGREPAPLAAAGALGYALLGAVAGQPARHGLLQVLAVWALATLAGALPRPGRGRAGDLDHLARRCLTLGFVALCCRPPGAGPAQQLLGAGPPYVLRLLALVLLTALCDACLAALQTWARTREPFGTVLNAELRALRGIGSAVCASGAVMALAVGVAGLWALPLVAVPLLLAQLSFGRYAAVRGLHRETVAALARAPEIAGHTPPGHAARVAELSRAIGRELGLGERRLAALEYAALLHDVGQLSLVDPVQDGATAPLPAPRQRRIAHLGAEVARQAGLAPEVARVVERQADPVPRQPLGARIVRVANAYEEFARGGPPAGARERQAAALARLRARAGVDYAPDVVESLARVLERERRVRAEHSLSRPRTG